jgi:hypothetical protein
MLSEVYICLAGKREVAGVQWVNFMILVFMKLEEHLLPFIHIHIVNSVAI